MIALAAIYAEQVMGFKTKDTIMLILVVNVTAAIGAFGFGYAQDRLGKVVALRVTIVGWVAMTVIAYLSQTPAMFWIAANIAGLCMGSSQSAGRALVATSRLRIAARNSSAVGVATRLAAIPGPPHLRRSHVDHGRQPPPGNPPHRRLLLHLARILAFVNERRGRAQVATKA